MKKHAFLSVTDKTGILELGRGLSRLGYALIATGGTALALRESGLEVTEAGMLSGFGELLGGRVKSLAPQIFAGLLARRDSERDMAELDAHDLPLIDIVVCNLYNFSAGAERREELIDIGGVSIIRAGAKNAEAVYAVTSPAHYHEVLEIIEHGTEDEKKELRRRLAADAWRMIAEYDMRIASAYCGTERLLLAFEKHKEMRYGENPHQQAAWWTSGGRGLHDALAVEGKELSYNNILDAIAAFALVEDLGADAAAVIKHQNPCGAAKRASASASVAAALAADSESAYGGIVALNGSFDAACAEALKGCFIELIVARSITSEAKAALAKRKNLRAIEWNEPVYDPIEIRSIPGGILTQSRDIAVSSAETIKTVSKRAPSFEERSDLLFADIVAKHVKSNAIVLAKGLATVGIGAGQMNRSDSVKIAVMKAGERISGAVMASDGFFPFSDGIENAAGVTAVIQPGGSIRDAEVIEAADRLGIALCLTGSRHFKH